MTKDGQYLKVRCAAQNQNAFSTAMASTKAHDFGECLQFCGVTPGCKRSVCTFATFIVSIPAYVLTRKNQT